MNKAYNENKLQIYRYKVFYHYRCQGRRGVTSSLFAAVGRLNGE